MKDWLAANLFLLVLALVSALTFFLCHQVIVLLDLSETPQRFGYGLAAIASLLVSGCTMKLVLDHFERRR